MESTNYLEMSRSALTPSWEKRKEWSYLIPRKTGGKLESVRSMRFSLFADRISLSPLSHRFANNLPSTALGARFYAGKAFQTRSLSARY
jgi:hypothetical protein